MTDIKPDPWLPADDTEPHACDVCGAKLFPGDWLTRDGCCYCDAGLDMSGDYSRLARWRTTDRGELAKAMRVPKPAPVPDGQMEMFA